MALWRKVRAPVLCCLCFIVIFISLKNSWVVVRNTGPGPEYGLLLFLLPGMLTAMIARESPIFSSFVGGLTSIPLCFLLRWALFPRIRPPVQELAYATSAIFWCVLGAMLIHLLMTAYRQFRHS